MNETVERIRAVLRLLGNEEITPTGRRMIEKVLDDEETRPQYSIVGDPNKVWTPEELQEFFAHIDGIGNEKD